MSDKADASKPLSGLTVLVTCSAKKMAGLVAGIEIMGGIALPFRAIETVEIEDKRPLDKALESLTQYSWLIFTSAYGVSFFAQRMQELAITPEPQKMPKVCAIGPATAGAAKESGFEVDLIAGKYVAEGVVEALGKYHGTLQALAGHRILLPRAREAREILPEALAAAGVLVDVVPCYQTVQAQPDDALLRLLRAKTPDLILFTSSSGIRSLVEFFGEEEGTKILLNSAVAVIGPVTARTAELYGKRAEIIPTEHTIDSLLEAVREYYSSRHRTVRDQQ